MQNNAQNPAFKPAGPFSHANLHHQGRVLAAPIGLGSRPTSEKSASNPPNLNKTKDRHRSTNPPIRPSNPPFPAHEPTAGLGEPTHEPTNQTPKSAQIPSQNPANRASSARTTSDFPAKHENCHTNPPKSNRIYTRTKLLNPLFRPSNPLFTPLKPTLRPVEPTKKTNADILCGVGLWPAPFLLNRARRQAVSNIRPNAVTFQPFNSSGAL